MNFFSWKTIPNKVKKMKRTDWLVVVLLGVLLLIIAIPTGASTDHKKSSAGEPNDGENSSAGNTQNADSAEAIKTYKTALEEELEEVLGKMAGVGKVEVMITLKNDGENVLDKDISTGKDSYSESTVIYRVDDGDVPYITSQRTPEVEGVVVVAEGGGDPATATNISDAVMALFDVEAHKIKIVKMSVQEGTK